MTGVAADAETSVDVGELVGRAGLDTEGSAFVVASSTVDAVGAAAGAAVALRVAGDADSSAVVAEVVDGTVLDADSIQGESLADGTGGTVFGVDFAGETVGVAGGALVDGGLVESLGAVEGADSADHDVGALVVASSVVEDLAGGTAGAGGVGAETGSTAVGAVLTGSVD